MIAKATGNVNCPEAVLGVGLALSVTCKVKVSVSAVESGVPWIAPPDIDNPSGSLPAVTAH